MSLGLSSGDLIGRWSLSFSDIDFVNGKPEPARLGFAVPLKFFAAHGFFVQDHAAIPAEGVLYLTPEDYRGLTPLIYSHVNPYGRFDLDLNSRIDFGRLVT